MIGAGAAITLVVFAIGVYKDVSSSLSELEKKSWMRSEQNEYRQLVDVKMDAMSRRVQRLEDFVDVKRYSDTATPVECQSSLLRWAFMDFEP